MWRVLEENVLQLPNGENLGICVLLFSVLGLVLRVFLGRLILILGGGCFALLLGRALGATVLLLFLLLLLGALLKFVCFDLLLGQLRREELVRDARPLEVACPRFPLVVGHHIGLVDEEEVLLLRVDILDVLFEILGPEKKGIPGVDNLNNNIGPLDDSPQLPPHLEISFKRSHQQILRLLHLGEPPAPLQEALALCLVQRLGRGGRVPLWPPRYRELGLVLALLPQHGLFLSRREEIGVPLVCVDDLDVVHLLGREIGAGELGGCEELVQCALLGDGAHLDPRGLLPVVGDILFSGILLDTDDGRSLFPLVASPSPEAVVHQGVAEPDRLFRLGVHHLGRVFGAIDLGVFF